MNSTQYYSLLLPIFVTFYCSSFKPVTPATQGLNKVTTPWYLKTRFTIPSVSNTSTLVDVVNNSTHLFVLDDWFRLYFFKIVTGQQGGQEGQVELVGEYDIAGWIGDDVCCGVWGTGRNDKVAVLSYNPFNDCLYLTKYTPLGNLRLEVFQFRVPYTGVIRYNGYDWGWWGVSYYQVAYSNPRLLVQIEPRDMFFAHYNDPTGTSPQNGFFIGRMNHDFSHYAEVFRTDEQAVYIEFKCRWGQYICVWTVSRKIYVYEPLYLTLIEIVSAPDISTAFSFDPKIVRHANDVRFYGGRKPNDANTFSVGKFNSTYSVLAAAELPYIFEFPYNGTNYDMKSTLSGHLIVGLTTNASVGLGDTDIVVSRFDVDFTLNSRLMLSTVKQDNLSAIMVRNEADLILIGTTDGNVSDPLQTANQRQLFLSYYSYLVITNVTSSKPNGVVWGDIIEISFESLPVEAFAASPLVTFHDHACTDVSWSGQKLLATIPPGVGGPYILFVDFQHLRYSNDSSSTIFMLSYVPVIRDIQPTEGPTVGFEIIIHADYLGTPGLDPVEVTVGETKCLNIVQLNQTSISCNVPQGVGRNHGVTISLGPTSNSTEPFVVSYEPPSLFEIMPINGSTKGGNIIEIMGKNFGFCQSSPCDSSQQNVTVLIGSQACNSVLLYNDSYATCTAPLGSGANQTVSVVVAGQTSMDAVKYSYNPPEITSILPPFLVSANPTVFIDGANFGNASDTRSVIFTDTSSAQNYTCPSLIWLSQEKLRCNFSTTSIPLLSTFNISVIVTAQSSLPSSTAQFYTFTPNKNPIAMPYNTTTYEDQFITIELTASDPDAGDTIQLFIVSMPSNGTLYQVTATDTKGALVNTTFGRVALTNSLNKIMYMPDQDFFGIDSFNFIAQDSQNADSLTQTATITLLPLDDPPKVRNVVFMLDEDTSTSFVLPVVDPDTPGSTSNIQLTILSLPSKGNLYIQNKANQTFDLIETIPYVLEESNLTVMFSPNVNAFGNPYSTFTYKANDGTSDSIINATVTLVVNPVNDAPIFNTSLVQNLIVYEDTDVIIPLDVTDADLSDTLVVKITNIRLNGTLFRVDRSTGSRTSQTVGEGSEIPAPPYQLYFVPARNFYTRSSDLDQRFNVSFSDGKVTFSETIEFAVLPVNDPPSLVCTSNVLLPSDVLIGMNSFHSIQLQVSDVDDLNPEFHLLAAPEKGYLNASAPLASGSVFTTTNLTFYPNNTGGAYPYGNFTVFAKDKNGGVSNHCTFSFRFSCPPAKYNNIYSNGTGPICAACLDGADCSQDGSIPPRPRYGYWQSSNSTFLPCFPAEACPGGENRCATGYAGDRCGSCANKYYRLNNECKLCPDDRTTRIVVIVLCLLIGTLMMFGTMRLVGKGPNYGLVNILINFIQYILILRELRLNWPPEFHIILNAISFINFNIELTSPECLLETDLNYGMKMKLTLTIPIVLAIDLFLFRFIGVMYSNIKKCFGQPAGSLVVRKSNDPKKTSAFLVAVRVYNSLLSIVFATVTTKALGFFDCTLEDDGFYYLDADNSVKCYTDEWYKEVPYAIAGIMGYVVGIPLYFSIMLYLLYQKKYDGPKWKNAKKVVSKVMDYDRIYKDEQQTFVVVQLLQKFSLIVISMFFTRHTGLQVVLTQTVLLVSLLFYLKYKPYNYPILNILEISSAVCSVLVLGLGLPFHVDRAKISGQTGLIIAMLFLIFAFIFAVICASVYEIQSKVRERVKSFRVMKRNGDENHYENGGRNNRMSEILL